MLRRRFLLAALCGVTATLTATHARPSPQRRYDKGLLWRVSKPGSPPSWLFGTLHLPDQRLWPLPAPVARAFASSKQLVLEMVPHGPGAARFHDAAHGGGDGGLAALVSLDKLAPLLAKLKAVGVPENVAANLKPWAALLLITTPPGNGKATSMDYELYVKARQRRIAIDDMDSVEEQIAVFDDIPVSSQLDLLEAAVDFQDGFTTMAAMTISAYLERNLVKLHQVSQSLADRRPAIEPHLAVLEKKIVHDRSVVMAYRMQSALRRGSAFVAIGASHLYGDKSVQTHLTEEYGWKLESVW